MIERTKKILISGIVFSFVFSFTFVANAGDKGVPQNLGNITDKLEDVGDNLEDIKDTLADIAENLQNKECCNCATIKEADDAEGLITNPASGSTHDLVNITGPGTFVAARMTKQGGASGLTAVSLEIDGKVIVQRNIAALKNWGLTQNNPFGVVVNTSAVGIDAVTIGFQQPIEFENSLVLRAIVGEPGVVQIIGTVIHGK
ncbi:MAG: hypothetical protein OEV42_08005 [Deltaproteobacteria bacterium]|nr:hypothetical protein [Deltaproteobacteria bacterium]